MSEQIVNNKTFDLGAVIAGQDYPTQVVSVYFDERAAYTISVLNEKVRELSVEGGDEHEEAEKELQKLIEDLESRKYEFHLQGIPTRIRKSILDRVEAEMPQERNGLGMNTPNPARDELFVLYMFESYIAKIVDPDGAEIVRPSLETLKDFRDNAPKHALMVIEQGIADLETKTAFGFELTVKSVDFLSKP
jgi:hypothetical protein